MHVCACIDVGIQFHECINLSLTHTCSSMWGSNRVSCPTPGCNKEHEADEMEDREARKRLEVIQHRRGVAWTMFRGSYTCPQLITPGNPMSYTGPGTCMCSCMVCVFRHLCILERAVGVKERCYKCPRGLGDWIVNDKETW